MYARGIESELVSFINCNKAIVDSKRNAFFLVSLSSATKSSALKEEWLNNAKLNLEKQIKVKFKKLELIADSLKFSRYSWPVKWIMKIIAKKVGGDTDISKDYEYTNWNQVKSFAYILVIKKI